MALVVTALLILAVASFVAWPFFNREPAELSPEAQLTPLERQKLEAYGAIKEAEFDYQMGKLTDTDFAMLREKYTRQALSAITAIESAHAETATPIGKGGEGRKPRRIAYCPACGHSVPPRANFCSGCGRSLRDAVA